MQKYTFLVLAALTITSLTAYAYAEDAKWVKIPSTCNEWSVTYENGTVVEEMVCNWKKVTTPAPPALNPDILTNATEAMKEKVEELNKTPSIPTDERPTNYEDFTAFEKIVWNAQKQACDRIETGSERPGLAEICRRADVDKLRECTRGIHESSPVQTFGTFLISKEMRNLDYTPDYHDQTILKIFDMAMEECIAQRMELEPNVLGRQYLNLSQEPEGQDYHADLVSTNATFPSTPAPSHLYIYFEGQIAKKSICEGWYNDNLKEQLNCPNVEQEEECLEPTTELILWAKKLDPYETEHDWDTYYTEAYEDCLERNAVTDNPEEPNRDLILDDYYKAQTPYQKYLAWKENPNDPRHIVRGEAGDWKVRAGLR
jgi:hypothetical protein